MRAVWRRAVMPGALSGSHAFLADDCAACHVPVSGVDPARCVACHADNGALLQRQPTAFHADIQTCSGCHVEHQGTVRMPTTMNHAHLARTGLQLAAAESPEERARLLVPGRADAGESLLKCASCHATKDRHQGYFGADCGQCHATAVWTISDFRHPSPRSTECAQCHKPPPSHAMMHFSMVSAAVARQPKAEASQCYLCHQTTSWNDIKGVGWFKHH